MTCESSWYDIRVEKKTTDTFQRITLCRFSHRWIVTQWLSQCDIGKFRRKNGRTCETNQPCHAKQTNSWRTNKGCAKTIDWCSTFEKYVRWRIIYNTQSSYSVECDQHWPFLCLSMALNYSDFFDEKLIPIFLRHFDWTEQCKFATASSNTTIANSQTLDLLCFIQRVGGSVSVF